jgi:sulfonate ABC superfamily ATP binding cassette transporter, periplamic sulfonate-binding protein
VEIGRVADFLPDYQVTVLFTSAKRAQDNPQSLAAFRRGFAKGAALYNAALVDKSLSEAEVAAVVADVHRYVFVDKPEAEAARLIQAGAMRVSPDAALNRADVLKQVQWFKDEKLVPDALDGNALLVD